MNNRREIQEDHEIFLIDCFINWWEEKTGEKFKVISRPHPHPPEAIILSNSRTTWLEVTDTFFSDEFARDLYSYATPGEEHVPMASGPFENMDDKTALRFVNIIKKKLCKSSYETVFAKYGQGYLLVGMQSIWFDGKTCELMAKHCRNEDWSSNKGYFSKIFISFRSLNRQVFEEWKY